MLNEEIDRRTFAKRSLFGMMMGGLVAAYGTFAGYALRFLFPPGPQERRWLFVCERDRLKVGESMIFVTPNGAKVNVARQAKSGEVDDFIALSRICPHLGCQVHWELQNKRFFCPCHNGVFDPSGKGIGGPPGEMKLSLPRYPLRMENNLLMIEVPVESLRT